MSEFLESNPFGYGRPIIEPGALYGRDLLLKQIAGRLRNTAFESTSIVGERRSGKTSVLKVLMHDRTRHRYGLDDSHAFVFIDCSVVDRGADERAVWAYILSRIAAVLPAKLAAVFSALDTTQLTNLQLMTLFARVKRESRRVVLLLDEFDALTRNANLGPDFYASLRSLAIHHPLALVTTSYTDLTQTTQTEAVRTSPFFNIFHTIYLRPLAESAALKMLAESVEETAVSFSGDDVVALLDLAGTHPFYLKVAAHGLYEAYVQEMGGAARRWRFVRDMFYEQSAPHFEQLWRYSDDEERILLISLAMLSQQGEPSTVGAYSVDILTDVHRFARRTLRTLERRGVVITQPPDHYRLFGGGFELWLIEELQATLVEQQQFAEWLNRARQDSELSQQLEMVGDFSASTLVHVKVGYRPLVMAWLAAPQTQQNVLDLLQTVSQVGPADSFEESPKPAGGETPRRSRYAEKLDYARLRRFLVEFFDESKLRDLCFDLGVDYGGLRGAHKNDKARELIVTCRAQGRVQALVDLCREMVPHLPWDAIEA